MKSFGPDNEQPGVEGLTIATAAVDYSNIHMSSSMDRVRTGTFVINEEKDEISR